MFKYEPARVAERLLDACIGICLGATALYGAVWLLQQIWPWIVGIGAVLSVAVVWIWWGWRW